MAKRNNKKTTRTRTKGRAPVKGKQHAAKVKSTNPKKIFKEKLSLVIPCYNEEARVGLMAGALKKFDNNWSVPYEVIVADDGSTDNTVALVKEKLEGQLVKCDRLEIVQLNQNQGKGGALKAGVAAATGDFILTLDADMATEPLELLNWLKKIPTESFENNKIYIGSREHADSKIKGRSGRRVAGLIFNFFTQLFSPLTVQDTQCGFKLYPAEIGKSLFAALKEKGWSHDVELLYRAKLQDIAIEPMPVNWKHVEETKINVAKDGLNMFIKTFVTSLRMKWDWFIGTPIKEIGQGSSSIFRLLFAILTLALLVMMPILSFDYGITADEHVQKVYGELVLEHFATDGEYTNKKGENAMNYRNLYFYGGMFDYTSAWFNKNVGGLDEYDMRHLLNSLVGFLLILFTGLLAKEVSGSWAAGFFALVLIALSPRIFGHSMNNPKDIPFAAAFIFTVLHLLRFIKQLPRPSAKSIAMVALGIALAINVRVGGILLVAFLGLFTGVAYLWRKELRANLTNLPHLGRIALIGVGIAAVGYLGGMVFWPYGRASIFENPLLALNEMSNFSTSIQMVFNGRMMWSDELPWYYIPQWILMAAPLAVLVGAVLFMASFIKRDKSKDLILGLLLFAGIFPPVYAIFKGSSLYDGMRHFLFVYPVLIVAAAYGWDRLTTLFSASYMKWVRAVALAGLLVLPLLFMVKEYPYHTSYFNEFVGGTDKAYGKYETDYWMIAAKEMCEWFAENVPEVQEGKEVKVAFANQVEAGIHYFKRYAPNVKVRWIRYSQLNTRDDYEYGITFSRVKDPNHLKNGTWPPGEKIYEATIGNAVVGAIYKKGESYAKAGNDALKAGNYQQAIDLLEKELAIHPKNDLALIDLGNAYGSLGQLEKMYETAQRVLALSDMDINGHYLMGNYYLRKNDTDNAIKSFEKIIELNYKSNGANYYLAQFYAQKGMTQQVGERVEAYAENGGNQINILDLGINATGNKPAVQAYLRAKKAYFQGDGNGTYNNLDAALRINPNYQPAVEFKRALDRASRQ